MSESSKTTEQSQSSSTRPWDAAMPLVNSLLSGYGNLNTGVTNQQSDALTGLKNSVSNLPNFGGSGAEAIAKLFRSDSSPQVGMLTSAYDAQRGNLGATASGANLNPYETPGFADALRTATDDALNRVKGVYAGSGRDPSGAGSFAGTAARGITQGTAPVIASQFNQNMANMLTANRDLLSGAGSTASAINNLRQSDFSNYLAGITGAGSLTNLAMAPALAQYGVADLAYSQPFKNLAQLLQPSVALASLGSESQGQGTSTQTSNPSLLDSLSSGFGTAGKGLGALGALFALSDERAKEDIAPVGKLLDGQTVYSYRYKGSPRTELGLIAQEVEARDPGAVADIGGLKHVNYERATRRARVGALLEAA